MKTKFKSQRKGAVLMTVTVVSVMMVVIIAAASSLVAQTNVRTNTEYRKKQAYYVAASCIRAFVSQTTGFAQDATHTSDMIMAEINRLKRISDMTDPIEVQIDRIDHGTPEGVGTSQPRWNNAKCTIKVEKVVGGNANNLKVISTGYYLGQEKTVVAYLSVTPLHMNVYTPKALEIIGTDGGIEGRFENIQVYGATGATDMESHNQNTVYKFNHNDNKLFGDTDINGSLSIQNQNRFKSNPYYYPGVDESKGCVLNVSRSLVINKNNPTFEPDFTKNKGDDTLNPQLPEFNYNYVNVREAMVITSEGAHIGPAPGSTGWDDTHQVDTYTSMLYIGEYGGLGSGMKSAMAASCSWGETAYWDEMATGGWGNGCGNTFNGNIYTYDLDGKAFNGDMVVNTNDTKINGDIYLTGDLYLNNGNPLGQFSCGTIHLLPDKPGEEHHVYRGIDRTFDGTGGVVKPADSYAYEDTLIANGINVVKEDWTNIARAQRPEFPLLSETPYYYYPEHLLCEPGTSATVSTIWQQYKNMYKSDLQTLDTDNIKSVTDESYSNKNSDGTYINVYGDPTGVEGVFKPDYVVTDDCYIENLNNNKILIDVDACPKDNLVVILKDGGKTMNQNVILVKNSTNPDEDENAKFCYIVSDSGFGETEDTYAATGEESWYDHESFKTPTFTFGGTREIVMDLDAFLHCDCYTEGDVAKGNGGSLNPTPDPDRPGYKMTSNNIIMLFTEGSELYINESNVMFHASIYMPRATYHTTNKGGLCKIEPYYHDADMDALAIIGNIVCNQYQIDKGNRNAIVYNPVSKFSMLAYTKGFGDEHAEESFQLINYAAS